MDLNRIMLIGNLTRDPETRHTQSGAQVTNFTIAVNDRSRGRQNETTMFIRVDTWNKTAEIASQYLQKGSMVLVEGRLKIDEYETRDGQKRRDPVVTADRISLGPRPRDGQGGGGGYSGGGGGYDDSPRRSEPPRRNDNDDSVRDSEPDYDGGEPTGGGTDDDLPF